MKYILFCFSLLVLPVCLFGQQVDLANLKGFFGKGKPLKLNGGLNASSVFHNGTESSGRQPFTWYMNGNMNLNIYGKLNLPFSFNLTNAGANYSYPTTPNRLSLHPTYKGITGHIGDVAMSFSPYTLNGVQFRGVGVDVAPTNEWSVSAMYGRLSRAIAYDSANKNVLPTYQRIGYGTKLTLTKKTYGLGFSIFTAADDPGSIPLVPDSLYIFPKKNVVFSVNGMVRPVSGLELTLEYANSAMRMDKRDFNIVKVQGGNLLSSVFMYDHKSTLFYKAIKAGMNYTYHKSMIGLGYERIDPGYQTLGAYYFNNDLENITVNFSQPFLKDKANVSVNLGYQRDDLANTKSGSTSRMVSSVNMNYMPNQQLNMNLSYSNFQTYMNMKSQFDAINQVTPIQNLDTLNFTQISQNTALNVNYVLKTDKQKSHSVNMNFSLQDAADLRGGVLHKGDGSRFYNSNMTYTLMLIPRQISINTAFNMSYNTIGRNDYLTLGPTIAVNAKLLQKKMNAGGSLSYNASTASGASQGKVLNLRANAGYRFVKKHNLNLSAIRQTRWVPARGTLNDQTVTLGYNYNF
jgi:hypothetical protein